MPHSKKTSDFWYRLDNAGTIYPSVSTRANTNVFRLCCEMHETVDNVILQQAVDISMPSFPYFRAVLRRGFFWYYLEGSDIRPVVQPDTDYPFAPLFFNHRKELLIRITYFNRRINLDMFHALADGNGGIQLLNAIVYNYIRLRYKNELPDNAPPPPVDTMSSTMMEDSFSRYYDPELRKKPFHKRALTIGGTMLPPGDVRLIEATVPTKPLLALAKSKGVTVTAYLAALLILSIYKEMMPRRVARTHPIGLIIPVDLRGHFASETARNFFGVAEVRYDFSSNPNDFDSILASMGEQLKKNIEPSALASRISYTMHAQKNIFARFTPLFLKNIILKAVYSKSESATTAIISNMGRIAMPAEYASYINRFICLISPTTWHRFKICFCSYQDQFVIAMSSCIAESGMEKYFVRHLRQNGIEVCLTSNGGVLDESL